ncbi:MAG: D-aminoacyl-tRNA deacylase [Verrucomicrobiota bacterium]
MRVLLQRVSQAKVEVDGRLIGQISQGLLLLLGIEEADTEEDIEWLVRKAARMRLFADAQGKMNASLHEVQGQALIVSQFTLHASTKKGHRPSFLRAAAPAQALPLYHQFLKTWEKETGRAPASGQFGAAMEVSLVNDGPVTIWIDSKARE